MTMAPDKTRAVDIIQTDLAARFEGLDAKFARFAQDLDARFPKPVVEVPMARNGVLAPIERAIPHVGGIDLGAIAVGGVLGLIAGEAIDGFVPPLGKDGRMNVANVVVKGLGAAGFGMYGKNLMSPTAAHFAAGVLLLQVLRDVLPIDTWVDTMVGWVRRPMKQAQNEWAIPVHSNGYSQSFDQPNPTGIPSTDKLASMFG